MSPSTTLVINESIPNEKGVQKMHGESFSSEGKLHPVDIIDSAEKISSAIAFHGKRFIEVDVDDDYLRARKRSKKNHRKPTQITLAGCASSIFESLPKPDTSSSTSKPSSSKFSSLHHGDCSNKDLLLICKSLVSPDKDDTTTYPQVSDEEESTNGTDDNHVQQEEHDPLLQCDIHPVEEHHSDEFHLDDDEEPLPGMDKKMERRASAPVIPSKAAQARKVSPTKQDRRRSMSSATLPPEFKTEMCLGEKFVPGKWDVVCGRGKNWSEHISNRRFRILVAMNLKEYFQTTSRTRKSMVINSIVTTIQTASGEGFVKKRGNSWYRITTKEAREKTSHCLRDCITDPQHEQAKWSDEQLFKKLEEAQDHVFKSLSLMDV